MRSSSPRSRARLEAFARTRRYRRAAVLLHEGVLADRVLLLVRARREVTFAVLRLMARRLRKADRQRSDFAVLETVARVAERLAERFGEPGEEGIMITLPLSQEELGGWTGATREAVSKALQVMRSLGWIRKDSRRIDRSRSQALRGRTHA